MLNRYGLTTIVLGTVLAINTATHAEETKTNEGRWYISPSVNYIFADDDRVADNDIGLQLGLGKEVSENWNIELNLLSDQLDFETGSGKFKQYGLSVDALYFPDRSSRIAPYGLLGLGALRTKVPGNRSTDPIAEMGIGIMSHLDNTNMALRAEIRYRYNDDDSSIPSEDNFGDWIVGLGLAIPFGGHSTPAPVATLDDDKDGIDNDTDRCPNTVPGATVNALGCELDNDNDGVKNSADSCPDTAQGTTVDARGCKQDMDSDNDGIKNSADSCPDTAQGSKVDAQGCELDSDNDGVKNSADNCPDTVPNAGVDTQGCELKKIIALKGVTFANNSAVLTGNSVEVLDEAAATLRRNADLNVEVAGYTDNRGSATYNVRLSQKRAETVRDYLVTQGVSADMLSAKGYGPENPLADNATADGRAANRRVELRILKN